MILANNITIKCAIYFFLVSWLMPCLYSQEGHYLVNLPTFSPPEKELIKTLKGFPAENFLAPDTNGEEHFLGDYREKSVVIWFWSVEDKLSANYLDAINILQLRYLDEVQIFGFATESKEILIPFLNKHAVIFPNFPNSSVFGDAVYGGDLGLGRLFFIDEYGIIKEVLPRSFFIDKSDEEISDTIDDIMDELLH